MAMRQSESKRRFCFIFPMASGHINPSFPVSRALVKLGHEVHYLCREQMRAPIEDTGARFHNEVEMLPELYEGREPDLFGAMESLRKEYGLEERHVVDASAILRNVVLELQIPGVLRWLQKLNPDVVVFCPLLSREGMVAARILGIPRVGILTIAGPGSWATMFEEFMKSNGTSAEAVLATIRGSQIVQETVQRVNVKYCLDIDAERGFNPLGFLDTAEHSQVTIVTTCEDLQDPMNAELASAYEKVGASFEAVGPLLDHEGALRAAGHKFVAEKSELLEHPLSARCLVQAVRQAKKEGRAIVLVSMGTVITGDHREFGWHGRVQGADLRRIGLTGRELCQAAWGGAFDAFGSDDANGSPLLLVSLGPQSEPLGDLRVPGNALCLPSLPQVDLLKAGVDLFLTHGGQNSFTEALSQGVPVVVCPGFGDQVLNARKAVSLGVGLMVERPVPEDDCVVEAIRAYRAAVKCALQGVLEMGTFKEAAARCALRLGSSGGVPRTVELLIDLAEGKPATTVACAGEESSAHYVPAPLPHLLKMGTRTLVPPILKQRKALDVGFASFTADIPLA